jgi:hypothetical protein
VGRVDVEPEQVPGALNRKSRPQLPALVHQLGWLGHAAPPFGGDGQRLDRHSAARLQLAAQLRAICAVMREAALTIPFCRGEERTALASKTHCRFIVRYSATLA